MRHDQIRDGSNLLFRREAPDRLAPIIHGTIANLLRVSNLDEIMENRRSAKFSTDAGELFPIDVHNPDLRLAARDPSGESGESIPRRQRAHADTIKETTHLGPVGHRSDVGNLAPINAQRWETLSAAMMRKGVKKGVSSGVIRLAWRADNR